MPHMSEESSFQNEERFPQNQNSRHDTCLTSGEPYLQVAGFPPPALPPGVSQARPNANSVPSSSHLGILVRSSRSSAQAKCCRFSALVKPASPPRPILR